jgi:hypothetical protein
MRYPEMHRQDEPDRRDDSDTTIDDRRRERHTRMTPGEKQAPVNDAGDEAGHRQTEPAMTTRTQGQQDTSDTRLKEIIARAVEKVKRPVKVSERSSTYPSAIGPFEKKIRPKGREGSR